MYVCICNALNERKVQASLDNGATTPAAVFRQHGCQVQCGKCVPTLRAMTAEHRATCARRRAQPDRNAQPAYSVAAE
ncbi:(2Fe-2S)-binding protein [Azospirillum griseum]|uniref:Bacterioferritin-associated ferredoxin n=1 Tax=Azospirillum griseum TaxID=2496639 RepID=A0A3S0K7U9_9PROT|nr:(2Fe-2S)-binding protein [Azospirillum griseum]RTR24275.1 (2Fe-2S)-binding protein [Azospirillum griseum]